METNIRRIAIKNFKGIESYEGQVFGRDVWLVGANGKNKSSFIDAVFFALTGKNIPPEPIKSGANKGLIEVELEDGFVVRVKLSRSKTPVYFEIENLNATDEKDQFVKSPRTWLNERVGILDFDVHDFFKKSSTEQVKYFCKITGLDVSAIDADIEEAMESRKFDKKKVVELKTKTGFYKTEDAEKEPIDIVKLSNDITALKDAERTKKDDYNRVVEGVAVREKSVREKQDLIAKLKAEIEGGFYYELDVHGVRQERKIEPSESLNVQIAAGYDFINDPANKPTPNAKLEEMENEFKNSTEINKTIEEAKTFKQVDDDIAKYEKQIEDADNDIERLRTEKAKVIAEKINIEGLTYDTEKEMFLLNGLPFDENQTNTAAQIIAGLKIGASLLNEIKILKVDASLIDKENFAKVQSWAKSEGIELFVELVDREAGDLKIIIDEQEAK